MSSAARIILILLCVLIFLTPSLYAQNEAIFLKITVFPEKRFIQDVGINNVLIAPFKPSVPKIEKADIVNYGEILFAPWSIPKSQSKQNIVFVGFSEGSDWAFWDFIEERVREDNIKKNEEQRIIREAWEEWLGIDIWYPYFKAKEIEDWICDRFKVEIFHFKGRLKIQKNQVTYAFKMRF